VATLVLTNMRCLELAVNRLNTKAVQGLRLNKEKIQEHLSDSIAIVTYLSQYIGHEAASRIYLRHLETKKPLRELICAEKLLTEKDIDALLSPEKIRMVGLKK
jgi:aspartate ammonia-lyase